MDVCTDLLLFFEDFEGLTEVFDPGRPPDICLDIRGISLLKTYS